MGMNEIERSVVSDDGAVTGYCKYVHRSEIGWDRQVDKGDANVAKCCNNSRVGAFGGHRNSHCNTRITKRPGKQNDMQTNPIQKRFAGQQDSQRRLGSQIVACHMQTFMNRKTSSEAVMAQSTMIARCNNNVIIFTRMSS
jgi:hypothetical protein